MRSIRFKSFKFAIPILAALVVLAGYGPVSALISRTASGSPASGSGHVSRQPYHIGADQGLVGYWNFDGNANDSSGQGNNGTLTNFNGDATDGYVDGKFGKGLKFDGVNDYINSSNNSFKFGTGDFAVSMWVYPTSFAAEAGLYDAQVLGGPGGRTNAFVLVQNASTGKLRIFSNASYSSATNNTVTLNTWNHIIIKRSGTTVTFYINGVADSVTITLATDISAGGAVVGRYADASSGYYSGSLDDVRIYNRALSSAEITQLYQGSQPTTCDQTCVGYWPLDESGATARDATLKNANNLTDNNTVTQAVGPGGTGNAAQFTKANLEYLSIPDNSSVSLGDIDMSLSGWVYMDSAPSPGETRVIIGKQDDNIGFEWTLNVYNNSGVATYPSFQVRDAANTTYGNVSATIGVMAPNQWYYIAAWHDSVANTLNIQVDNGTVYTQAWSGGIRDSTAPLTIGSTYTGGGFYWDGRIADVGLWHRVLTSGERTSLYNSGNGKTYAGLAASEKDSLVSYWNLDEASGTRMDSHGGTGLVTEATSGEGVFGGGRTFDGVNDVIRIPHNSSLDMTTDYTLSAWVNPVNIHDYEPIFVRGEGSVDDIELYISQPNQLITVVHNRNNGGSIVGAQGFANPIPGSWSLLSVTYTGGTVTVYLNGAKTGSSLMTAPLDTDKPWMIGGADHTVFGGNNRFQGGIDDVRIYNRALADYEIYAMYAAGRSQ